MSAYDFPLLPDSIDRVVRWQRDVAAMTISMPIDGQFEHAIVHIRCRVHTNYFSIRSIRLANDRVCNSMRPIRFSMLWPSPANG